MRFIADLHIHSKYSRATSKENNILSLYAYSKIKGIDLLATGDFTHPAWIKEIEKHLKEDGQGLLDLKKEYKKEVDTLYPQLKEKQVKFIFSVEISSIYKRNDRVRKVHNLILMPDFKSVKKLNEKLGDIGNIRSDGRPILGLDSKNLLEITLDINPEAIFIPAHIWTPWFSLFGMKSGFDTIEECYDDLAVEIFAVETGLSSDPAMNWRLPALDRFNLVSNSDAHSPNNLAREANLFDTDLNYYKIRDALKNKKSNKFSGTIEFFPEEGKYHYDGHRNCSTRMTPVETLANKMKCPVCKKPVTVGVLHRVEELATRKQGAKPVGAKDYKSIIPLKEIIGDAFGVGSKTKKVENIYSRLINQMSNELFILTEAPIDQIEKHSTGIIAEGIKRVRNGKVEILPGYDGEYGKVIIFSETDRLQNVSQSFLIPIEPDLKKKPNRKAPAGGVHGPGQKKAPRQLKKEDMLLNDTIFSLETSTEMNKEQQNALQEDHGPIIVIAGPGTGKTYTLIRKIIYLIKEKEFLPENILGITFTNKAADEIMGRLNNAGVKKVNVSTFHSLALNILKENNFNKEIFDENDSRSILKEALKELNINLNVKDLFNRICRIKSNMASIDKEAEEFRRVYEVYQAKVDYYRGMDYEDIIIFCYKLLKKYPDILSKYKKRYKYILVDEFQDVNFSEYSLIKILSDKGRNLFVIGDPDQSIYKFRGSDPGLIFKLADDFSLSKKILLKKNYRNPENIMKAGIDIIKTDSKVIKKYGDMNILIKSNVKIDMIVAPSQLSAGIQIAKKISGYIGGSTMLDADIMGAGESFTFKDFAILVRMASQIPGLEETLLYEGIPYKIMGGKSFLDEPIIRLGINILRLKTEEFNNFRFFRIIQSDHFKVPNEVIKNLRKRFMDNPDADLIRALDRTWKGVKNVNAFLLKRFLRSSVNEKDHPDKFFKDYKFEFFKDDGFDLLLNIAGKFKNIKAFLSTVLLGREQDIEIEKKSLSKLKNIESVSILTLHSAKGLEFPIVFIYEPVEGVMPFLEKEDKDISEERRLFYVGMTRAGVKLFFIIPEKRKKYGRIVVSEQSRFIDEIKEDWLNFHEVRFDSKFDKDRDQLRLF